MAYQDPITTDPVTNSDMTSSGLTSTHMEGHCEREGGTRDVVVEYLYGVHDLIGTSIDPAHVRCHSMVLLDSEGPDWRWKVLRLDRDRY